VSDEDSKERRRAMSKLFRKFPCCKTKYVGLGILSNSKYGYMWIYRKITGSLYLRIHGEKR
jgi:hypothetical protein